MSQLPVLKRILKNIKPVLLGVVLTFVAGSYFTSDPFTRGNSIVRGLPPGFVARAVCPDNKKQEQAGCEDRATQALVTANVACVARSRDVWVCEDAISQANQSEHTCPQEKGRLSTCLKTHLKPQLRRFGFTAEEIALLGFSAKDEQKKGAEDGGGGKEEREDASDKGAQENVDAVDGGPGAPEVKVEEAPKRTNGNVR